MGAGIVRSFASAGFRVAVVSRRAGALADLPPGVSASASLPPEPPDLVVETVVEEVEAKAAVYRAVEDAYPPETLIGTNTSGLPLERLAEGLRHPERFLGIHWFQPAEAFPMVEVVAGQATPPAVVDRVARALERTGKEALVLYKPVVGYVINRLQHTILHEAYHMIEAGIASAETIDKVARWLLGPRLCITGLVEQKDIGGLTPHALAQRSIVPTLDHTGVPNPLLQDLIARGETGLDAGRGFYDWTGLDAAAVRRDASARLARLLEALAALRPAHAPRPRSREELPATARSPRAPATGGEAAGQAPAPRADSIEAVVFDIGGVVLDSPLHAIARYEKDHGLPPNAINRVVVAAGEDGAWARLERGELTAQTFCEPFEADCRAAGLAVDAALLMDYVAASTVPRPRMLEAIRRLRAHGLRVAALTNNWFTSGRRVADHLRSHFDVFVESAVVGVRKPDPRIYELVCRELGVVPARAVFLDDIGRNLKPARALGMTTIKVDDPDQALRELGALLGLELV